MLVREGHEVVEATDGTHGIRLAAARRFDLILMDISMPYTDGLQAAQAIRAGGGLSSGTPIIALTAHALPSDTERFRAGGMQQVLVKPITRETLHAAIASVLHGGTAVPPDAAVVNKNRLIDRSVLDGLAQDLGRERANTLTRRFLAETSASIDLLLRAASADDADTSLLREVHRLEGSAGMFGALAMHDALSRIETLCKARDLAAAHALIPDLARLWQGTMAAYEADDLPQLSSLR
jgi:CheY-like chemotaxis protein/HPt (histidine-containing phosphotransfer) domain-containing protein